MARRNHVYTKTFEIERNQATVEYEATWTVTPGEKPQGPTYDSGGYPGSDPEVEDVEVFWLRDVFCGDHLFPFRRNQDPRSASCRECKKVREPRPELVDLVDPAELLEEAGEVEAGRESERADYEHDRRRDDRLTGHGR